MLSMADTSVNSNNILSNWLEPTFDDVAATKEAHPLTKLRGVLARPHMHSNNQLVSTIFGHLIVPTPIYDNTIGPRFRTLPLDLQLHILFWYKENISALAPCAQAGVALLEALVDNQSTSTTLSVTSMHSLAHSLLQDIKQVQFAPDPGIAAELEVLAIALQSDLVQSLASSSLPVQGLGYFRSALSELDGGEFVGTVSSDTATQAKSRAFLYDVADAEESTNPLAVLSQTGDNTRMDSDLMQTDENDGATEANMLDFFSSQVVPPSQEMEYRSTHEMDVDGIEQASSGEPPLSAEDENRAKSLADRLGDMDAGIQSQVVLTSADVAILSTTRSPTAICALLELDKVTDETICAFLRMALSDDASFARNCIILQSSLQSRIETLTTTASRSLLNAILVGAELQPQALLEAVLVPMLSLKTFSSAHAELAIRTIKALDAELQEPYINTLLKKTPKSWNRALLDLVAKLLPLRSAWSADILKQFISQIHAHINDNFGGPTAGDKMISLVWSIVVKYSAQDLSPHKQMIINIAQRFNTSLSEKVLSKVQSWS